MWVVLKHANSVHHNARVVAKVLLFFIYLFNLKKYIFFYRCFKHFIALLCGCSGVLNISLCCLVIAGVFWTFRSVALRLLGCSESFIALLCGYSGVLNISLRYFAIAMVFWTFHSIGLQLVGCSKCFISLLCNCWGVLSVSLCCFCGC